MMRKILLLLAIMLAGPLPLFGQSAPEWYFTKISDQEYALWHNGAQVGNYRLSDESYFPRIGKGRWGEACECPCYLPPAIEAALASYRALNWKTRGVQIGPVREKKSALGLHYHNLRTKSPAATESEPPLLSASLSDDVEKIPDYSAMPSLTLVARDEASARAALEMFEQAPELAKWREKYGPRAKAYSEAEFRHTGAAFKLDQDRQFQNAGFVAIIQPQAPDEQGRAAVKSYYTWATPEQALKALRDADPAYDPNPAPAPVQPAAPAATPSAPDAGIWGKAIAGLGLGGSSVLMVLGTVLAVLRSALR